ncbi:MAG TPA: DNA helicase Rep [Candidatus Thiothrix moscowensis]|uniref:DNA helicase Rep n=1 Tax=unclassified Thiothrix TaxID=2636184 RepID=UPI0025D2EE81|nr:MULTISPECIES: DNA helicase Rep [unclassified Thiothrix]HRJ52449.1 DNA helicase Rep [Candidatus Thiothrix moscowensis]HRJ93365.1 DNA helicase Rep [Candidatus Thiothrix moscowensis]
MQGLNPQQQEAVTHLGTPLLVLAGAGSGKTRVITQKIAWMIRKGVHSADQIAAITFTNKAAREMRERASKLLSKEEAKGLTVSTFHTLGLNIIKREAKRLGYKSNFSILDAQDSGAILKELAHKEDVEEADNLRWIISRWKNDFISVEQAALQANTPDEKLAAILYEKYQRQIKAYNAVDFDDLIVLPVQLFEQHPDALQHWQNKLRYLLVDEYQDTNACQYKLIRLLSGMRGALTAVGDDDQSIYAWRGARPENIIQLQRDYPMLKVVMLEQNYRSTSRILNSANKLIGNNPHLFSKNLWSTLGEGDPIRVMPCRTPDNEAEKVVGEILKKRFRDRAACKDFAILYRSNHQSRLFEKALRENNIPYKLTGGTSFFERSEVKDILAYLRLIANPDDDAAFLRIINTPKREIGTSTLEKLGEYAFERHSSLFAAAQELGFAQRVSAKAQQRVETFSFWLHEMVRSTEGADPTKIVRQVITDIAYEDWLKNTCNTPKQAEARMKNVWEIVEWVRKLHDDGAGKETLSDIIAHMSLVDMLERNSEEQEQDAVTLMTLHAAKGLEFPNVFLVGMEEELLPHANSLDDHGIQEERRLAYVGITRAQKHLTISYAKVRSRYGESSTVEPSRFLDELPPEHLEWENKKVVSDEERQATAQAYIANLKDLLGD